MFSITFAVVRAVIATRTWLHGRIESDRGASAVEYALLVGLIAAVIVAAVTLLGSHISGIFGNTASTICGTPSACTTPSP